MMADYPIFIKKFWTEYKPDPTPDDPHKMREVDWVAYAPIGSVQKTLLTEAISRLSAVQPLTGRESNNPAVQMAHSRWNAIKPHYEAWKAGRSAPVEGTPLAAWNGLSPEQAEVFKMKGVYTVENIAGLTDVHKQTMGVPGLHNIIENAKRFLAAQDKSVVTNALAQKDAEIASLKEQMEELAKLTQELMAKQTPGGETGGEPKRRGRPPKNQEQPAAA